MNSYKNIAISKELYKSGKSFSAQLEKLDPSDAYKGSDLAGYDAFQRQLKRFGIRVSGADSDPIHKFFATSDSAALFPEYVSRAVKMGVDEAGILDQICASKTDISGLDYRTITADFPADDVDLKVIEEGGFIPETSIHLQDSLVKLHKRGRMLVTSYEAVKFQRIDLFTVALKQIGTAISRAQVKDAVQVLMSEVDGKSNSVPLKTAGQLVYEDLMNLWGKFGDYNMNVMLASPDMMLKILQIKELQDPNTGLNFQGTGSLTTPLGATLIKSSAVPEGKIIGIDKRFALEMVSAGGIQVEYDKLIDCQLERAAVTATTGFSKIFPNAVWTLG